MSGASNAADAGDASGASLTSCEELSMTAGITAEPQYIHTRLDTQLIIFLRVYVHKK